MGKAPAVITECWEELARSGIPVNQVVVLYTERVRQYFIIVKLDFLYGEYAGRVDVEGVQLPVPDVSSPAESKIFRKILFQKISGELVRGRVHLLVSGGRKIMVLDATLVALACGLSELLYVLQPAGGTIDVEPIAEYYDLERYMNNAPPTELMDKIHAACHPRIKRPILSRIALPLLDEQAREALASWVMG
jgi:hypothetical protein